MKKFLIVISICFMLTGCKTENSVSNENENDTLVEDTIVENIIVENVIH